MLDGARFVVEDCVPGAGYVRGSGTRVQSSRYWGVLWSGYARGVPPNDSAADSRRHREKHISGY